MKTGRDVTRVSCKSDTILGRNAFLIFQRDSIEIYRLDFSYCVSSPGYTSECKLDENRQEVESFRYKNIPLWIETGLREEFSVVHRPRFLKSAGDRGGTHDDVISLCELSMTQNLPYAEIQIDEHSFLETIVSTAEYRVIGCILQVRLKRPDTKKTRKNVFSIFTRK